MDFLDCVLLSGVEEAQSATERRHCVGCVSCAFKFSPTLILPQSLVVGLKMLWHDLEKSSIGLI